MTDQGNRQEGTLINRLPGVLWALSCLVIIGAIFAGLMQTGGPFEQRKFKMDARRVEDLNQLVFQIRDYYREHKTVPGTLTELPKAHAYRDKNFTLDPETNKSYKYRRLSGERFELCAVFSSDSKADRLRSDYRYSPNITEPTDFTHPAGHHCYVFRKEVEGNKDTVVFRNR